MTTITHEDDTQEVSPRQAQLLVLQGLVSEHEDGTHRIREGFGWVDIELSLDAQRTAARNKLLGYT